MTDRIVIKRVPVFDEDVALFSIEEGEVGRIVQQLSRDPLVGVPVTGEHGIRQWNFREYRILYHPVENYQVIVLLQIRPKTASAPRVAKGVLVALADLSKFLAKEGLKKWLGL